MRAKGVQGFEEKQIAPPKPYVEQPKFGTFFKKHGVYDGKMFHTKDKVTYTFVANEEVVSLHFDRSRQTIFYKGHSIFNIELKPEQVGYLEQFREVLEEDPETNNMVHAYNKVLHAYLREHPQKEL